MKELAEMFWPSPLVKAGERAAILAAKSVYSAQDLSAADEFLLDAKAAAAQKSRPFMGIRSSHRPGSIAAFVWSLFCLTLGSQAIAQVAIGPVGPSAIQSQNRADILRNPAAPLGTAQPSGAEGGYVQASPNDNDLGEQQILQRKEEYLPFTFSASMPVYYTSNVALVNHGAQDDVMFAPGLTLTYQPQLTRTLYAEVGVVQQWFIYGRFDDLNFASFDAIVGLAYYMPQFHNLTLRARYDYNSLTDTSFDQFFSNNSIILSGNMPFRIDRVQQIGIGFDAQLSFAADPDGPRRNEYSFWAGYSVNLTRGFSIDATARLAVRDYHVGSRTDVSEILSLSANYRINQWFTVSLLTSFSWNQSDQDVFDYSVADLGAGISGAIQF